MQSLTLIANTPTSEVPDGVHVEGPFRPGVTNESLAGPRRIAHVIKHCGYGNGSVNVAVDLACLQVAAGYDVTFVSAGGTFVPLLERFGVHVVNLPHEQNRPLSLLVAILKLTRLVWRRKIEVVHAHMMSSAVIGYVATRLSSARLVTTVHNSFDRHSVIMRLGDRVTAVSEAERDALVRSGYSARKVDVVLNGPAHSPRQGFLDHGPAPILHPRSIATVCGLHPRKGVSDLIAACAPLLLEMPEWRLYIVGEGPQLPDLQREAQESGAADKIVFLGFCGEPWKVLEQTQIFVLASHAEPFGLSLAEARAAGCALVATSVGGMPEILDHGAAGRLVQPQNRTELRTTLRELMTDDALRADLREKAIRGAERFDAYRLMVDYGEVYRAACRE